MDTDILILLIVSLLIALWTMYFNQTLQPKEYQTITEKIPFEVWDNNCTFYKEYQICEEGKHCKWEKKLKQPIYSIVCNDGHTKTEEHIMRLQ